MSGFDLGLAALRASPSPLLVVDEAGRVVAASAGLASAFGGARLEGLPFDTLPDPFDGLAAQLGVPGEGPVEIQTAAGTLFHAEARSLGEGHARLVTFEPARMSSRAARILGRQPSGEMTAADVLSSITDAFFALDRNWRFTYVNGQAGPVLERDPAELVGKSIWEEFPEAVGSPFYDAYHRAVETGEPVEFDAYYPPLRRHFDVRAFPFEGGVSVYFHDITGRVEAEAALRDQTEALGRQTAVFEAGLRLSAELAAELDPERLVQAIVDAGRQLTGAAFAAFFYTPSDGPAPPDDPDAEAGMLYALSGAPREAFQGFPRLQFTPLFHPTFANGMVVRADDVAQDPRFGQQAPLHGMPPGHLPVRSYLAVPVRGTSDEEGRSDGDADVRPTVGALLFGHPDPGVFDDAAERAARTLAGQAALALRNARLHRARSTELAVRRQTEAALLASEATLEAVLDSLPVAVIVADVEGRITRDNAANRELWGVPPDTESWEEYGAWEGYWPETGERLRAGEWAMARTLLAGERVRNELIEIAPFGGGPRRFMLNNAAPVRDAEGRITAGVIAQVDVTERRAQEEALRQKNAEMERFAYTVSHDLKSPLVTVTGFLGLMKSHLSAGRTEKAVSAADRVLGAAERMGQLIEDLLLLSRAGQATAEPEPVDLDVLTGRIVGELSERARAAGGEIMVEGVLGTVCADPLRMAEVVENLLANAVTYGLGGGGTRVVVCADRIGRERRLIVEDDGPGVPEAYRDRVFDLFQRLDTGGTGTGVGLAVVARVMEVMGGSAHVESAGGSEGREGARFVLTFPANAVLHHGTSPSDPYSGQSHESLTAAD